MSSKPKPIEPELTEDELDQEHAEANINRVVDEESSGMRRVETDDSALVAVPIETVPVNVALPCSIYIKVADRFPVLRQQGERLTSRRMLGLQGRGVNVLFIHKVVWSVFLEGMEKPNAEQPITAATAANHIRNLLLVYGQELERKLRAPKRPLFQKMQKMAEGLAVAIRSDPAIGSSLIRKYTEASVSFVGHALNTAIYVSIIAYKMKFSLEEMKLVTYAGLVHDVGELFIPKSIRYKKFELEPDEKELLNTHTRKGAELLQLMGSSPSVVLAALQHHERIDGKGYPSSLRGDQIHIFSKLVAVADTYDSLTSDKAYRAALKPAEAIEKMRGFQGQFDPQILGMVS